MLKQGKEGNACGRPESVFKSLQKCPSCGGMRNISWMLLKIPIQDIAEDIFSVPLFFNLSQATVIDSRLKPMTPIVLLWCFLQHLYYFLPFYHHSKLAKQRTTLLKWSFTLRKYSTSTLNKPTELSYFIFTKHKKSVQPFWFCCYTVHNEISRKLSNTQVYTSAVQRMASTKLH